MEENPRKMKEDPYDFDEVDSHLEESLTVNQRIKVGNSYQFLAHSIVLFRKG